MSFLKRLFGGEEAPRDATPKDGSAAEPSAPVDLVAEEQARDRELMLEEARRLDDDFIQRQMRYADRAWTPPAQGGTRRADDEDAAEE
ncbi:MAG TPA: hypothetical protein VFY23_12930 [Candidatus Limnocylindrales bacterium]|nr:hypothetical protein [Candidatus Limnocylindrales bacterium]